MIDLGRARRALLALDALVERFPRLLRRGARERLAEHLDGEGREHGDHAGKEEGERRTRNAPGDPAHGEGAEASKGETCADWYKRFKTYRQSEVGDVDEDAWRWTKWVSPHIGTKPIRDVDADDIENIRDALSRAVIAYEVAGNVKGDGKLAPKTAQNIWAALTTPMKYASTRRGPRELRMREDKGNPCDGIRPPRDGAGCTRRSSFS